MEGGLNPRRASRRARHTSFWRLLAAFCSDSSELCPATLESQPWTVKAKNQLATPRRGASRRARQTSCWRLRVALTVQSCVLSAATLGDAALRRGASRHSRLNYGLVKAKKNTGCAASRRVATRETNLLLAIGCCSDSSELCPAPRDAGRRVAAHRGTQDTAMDCQSKNPTGCAASRRVATRATDLLLAAAGCVLL